VGLFTLPQFHDNSLFELVLFALPIALFEISLITLVIFSQLSRWYLSEIVSLSPGRCRARAPLFLIYVSLARYNNHEPQPARKEFDSRGL
jgi:hypothetical protein